MIEIIQQATPEMIIEAYAEQRRLMMRPFLRGFFTFFALIAFTLGIFIALNNPRSPEIGVAVAMLFGYGLADPWIKKWRTRRQFREQPELGEPATWQFTPECYSVTSRLGSKTTAWKEIARIVGTPRGLLIYPAPKVMYWFPARLFAKPEDMAQVFEFAKTGGAKKVVKR